MKYPILIEKEDGEYIATLSHPNGRFQGACSGATKEEAMAEAEKLVEYIIASALADGEHLPDPKECAKGNAYVFSTGNGC